MYTAENWKVGPKEAAAAELLGYLQEHQLIDVVITPEQVDAVLDEIKRLIIIYGKNELGFTTESPQSLGPALRRFAMECEDVSHHNRNKIIHLKKPD